MQLQHFRLARQILEGDFWLRAMPAIQTPKAADPTAETHLAQADAIQSEIYKRMSPSRKLETTVRPVWVAIRVGSEI